MKKEFPWSFRLDQKTADRIQEVKKEYEWITDSEAGRNILEVGLEYLLRVKEYQKNPESQVEINEKMLKLLQSLAEENKIESILKDFDQETVRTIFRLSYLEDKEREKEKERKARELEQAKREAERKEKEEQEFKKYLEEPHKITLILDSGRGIVVKCKQNSHGKPLDIDGNEIDWS